MQKSPDNTKIIAKRRGNQLGFWCFRMLLKFLGLKGAYALLYLVCLHYLLFDKKAVSNARAYIKRRFSGCGLFKSFFKVYCLFVSQGKQLIDRFVIISGSKIFDIKLEGHNTTRCSGNFKVH